MSGTYNGRHYLTAYGKQQSTNFDNIIIDHDGGNYASASGIVSIENGIATLGDEGSVTYQFNVSTAGTYDVAVRLCYPFWIRTAFMSRLTERPDTIRKAACGGRIGEAPS